MQLTPQEQQNVIEAGRGAYRMLIDVSGNPHSKQPYRDLWDKGWRLERRKDEAKNNPRPTQPFKPRRQFGRDNQGTGRFSTAVPNQSNSPKSPTWDTLVNRFNNRFKTKAV